MGMSLFLIVAGLAIFYGAAWVCDKWAFRWYGAPTVILLVAVAILSLVPGVVLFLGKLLG